MKVKRNRQITLPPLSFKDRECAYVLFLSKMQRSDRVDEEDDGKEAATTARVLNLEDGKEYHLICPTVLVSSLCRDSNQYVGMCYEIIVSKDPKPGKRYKEVEVYAIDSPSEFTDAQAVAIKTIVTDHLIDGKA